MSPISTRICVPNLVAVRRSCRKKGGGGTDRQTKKTAALYSRLPNAPLVFLPRWKIGYLRGVRWQIKTLGRFCFQKRNSREIETRQKDQSTVPSYSWFDGNIDQLKLCAGWHKFQKNQNISKHKMCTRYATLWHATATILLAERAWLVLQQHN